MDVLKALRGDFVAARAEPVHQGRGATDAGRVRWLSGRDFLCEDEDEGGGEECIKIEKAEFRCFCFFG